MTDIPDDRLSCGTNHGQTCTQCINCVVGTTHPHNPQQTHDDSATHVAEIHHDNNWQPEPNETAHVVRQVSVGSETRPKYISRKEKKEKLAELGKTRRFGRSARNQYRETQCWTCCGQTWRICKENCQCECHLSDHLLRTEVDRELGIEVDSLYPHNGPPSQ